MIVYDHGWKVMEPGGYASAPLASTSERLNRNDDGELWVDHHLPIIDDAHVLRTTRYANHDGLPEPRLEAQWYTFPYWLYQRHARFAQLSIQTPQANVLSIREVKKPYFSGGIGFVFGLLLAGGGTGLIVATAESKESTAVKAASVGLATVGLIGPGIAALALDIYGLVGPTSDQMLYVAP